MKSVITYNIPDEQLYWILWMLWYIEGSKEEFMNKKIEEVVIPAITQAFVTIKNNKIQDEIAKIPHDTEMAVREMISITTE